MIQSEGILWKQEGLDCGQTSAILSLTNMFFQVQDQLFHSVTHSISIVNQLSWEGEYLEI